MDHHGVLPFPDMTEDVSSFCEIWGSVRDPLDNHWLSNPSIHRVWYLSIRIVTYIHAELHFQPCDIPQVPCYRKQWFFFFWLFFLKEVFRPLVYKKKITCDYPRWKCVDLDVFLNGTINRNFSWFLSSMTRHVIYLIYWPKLFSLQQ